jgi:hypothetical protein
MVSQRTNMQRAPHSVSDRGHGRGSVKALAVRVLLDVVVGASDELPLLVRHSFIDGRWSPSTRMEERGWQIMLEQFIASEVIVEDGVINIGSD